MSIQILMPALSPTMTEGKLSKWLKKEGDKVKPGQVIAEIETDKATMEVEAVDEGTIGKILVAAGTEGVAVNTAIAVLLEEGESLSPSPLAGEGRDEGGQQKPACGIPNDMMRPAAPPPHHNTQGSLAPPYVPQEQEKGLSDY